MKKIVPVLLVFFLPSLTHSQSYIQIKSESGISVFLDNEFKGETTLEFGGIIIENVSSGNHTLKFEKEGFNSLFEKVNIKSGEVFSYQLNNFIPKFKISQKGNENNNSIKLYTGSLKIQSLPLSIKINIKELNIISSKIEDEWLVEGLPIGEYKSIFSWNGKVIDKSIIIEKDRLTQLFVNFIKMEVEIISTNNINIGSYLVKNKAINEKAKEAILVEDVPFAIVEDVPVYPGCMGTKSELRKCLQDNITKHVNRKFNTDLTSNLSLAPGVKRIFVMFKIDNRGNIVDVMARAPNKRLQEEAIRAVNSLPKMVAGKDKGRNVGVKYFLTITFKVE